MIEWTKNLKSFEILTKLHHHIQHPIYELKTWKVLKLSPQAFLAAIILPWTKNLKSFEIIRDTLLVNPYILMN